MCLLNGQTSFCQKLSRVMKHGAFGMIPNKNGEVFNANSPYTHNPKEFARRDHK
jgi:hypothetical protein